MSSTDPLAPDQRVMSTFVIEKTPHMPYFRASLISDEDGNFIVMEGEMIEDKIQALRLAHWIAEASKSLGGGK